MKRIWQCLTIVAALAVLCFAQEAPVAPAPAPEPAHPALASVRTVYLLPMSSGMDQFLANRLTRGQVLQVVTDPAKADAVLTDHLGAAFEESVKELYPEAKPAEQQTPEQKAKPAGSEKSGAKTTEKDSAKATASDGSGNAHTDMKMVGEKAKTSTHTRGTLFLVKRGSWDVLWSAYNEPRTRSGKDLDSSAGEFAKELKDALKIASAPAPVSK